ncbi:MAG: DUF814 domain-containing protein [Candidatus Diapherotrites archaeon]|nr:DUF814 domain-containing protein [Candidatus Diapherotrites archaeon]
MRIEIDYSKSLEQNASGYFEKSKKSKKKLEGLCLAMQETKKKLERLEKQKSSEKKEKLVKKRKHAWFESFHWFVSSNGFLVVAGRSAKQNELLVKKHLEKNDMFLHADIQGGAATIIKSGNKKISDQTLKEAAQFAAVFSKAWQRGLASIEVYAVSKEQVSKKAPSGEALSTGAFMIYGKRKWFKPAMELEIGIKKDENQFITVSGPSTAIKKQSIISLPIKQGSQKPGQTAKKIRAILGKKIGEENIGLDEIIRMLPSSGISL